MDTIEDTLTNEAYARILHNLPPDSGDLLLPNEAERIWKGFVDYHSYPNPFDCFAWHKQFIAEKAFYFKGFLESLHGESERAAKGKLLTSPRKEV